MNSKLKGLDKNTQKELYHQLLSGCIGRMADANESIFSKPETCFFKANDDYGKENLYIYTSGNTAKKFSVMEEEIRPEDWSEYLEEYNYKIYNGNEEFEEKYGKEQIVKMYGKYWRFQEIVDMGVFSDIKFDYPKEEDFRINNIYSISNKELHDSGYINFDGGAYYMTHCVADIEDLKAIAYGKTERKAGERYDIETEKLIKEEQESKYYEKRCGVVTRKRSYSKFEEDR